MVIRFLIFLILAVLSFIRWEAAYLIARYWQKPSKRDTAIFMGLLTDWVILIILCYFIM